VLGVVSWFNLSGLSMMTDLFTTNAVLAESQLSWALKNVETHTKLAINIFLNTILYHFFK
jgi:hypothetical protein